MKKKTLSILISVLLTLCLLFCFTGCRDKVIYVRIYAKDPVNGKEIKEIWGWILPSDLDVGRSLKADLDNPDVNVAFSIRCFSRVVSFQGRTARIITKMITYDKIDIPGLKNAIKGGDREAIINSKSNITKESGLTDFIVDSTMLKNLVHELSNNVTTESAGIISTLEEIGQSMSEKKDIFYSW